MRGARRSPPPSSPRSVPGSPQRYGDGGFGGGSGGGGGGYGGSGPGGGAGAQTSLSFTGWTGRLENINGIYEPRGNHRGFPCWVQRLNNNCVFHTGKTRWVVSSELGDGSACYGFVTDDGSGDPTTCRGVWQRCDEQGQWREDRGISCSGTGMAAASDPFYRLRLSAEAEMSKVRITSEADRQKMWQRLDRSNDGVVDLAEVEALLDDLCKTGVWPEYLSNETALQRAYAKTLEESQEGDDQVHQKEFHDLLLNIFWFGKCHELFESINTHDDESLDINEFTAGMDELGLRLPRGTLERDFRSMDLSHDGCVDFAEFCLYVRKRAMPDPGSDGRSSHEHAKVDCHEKIRLHCGHGSTTGVVVKRKAWSDFDKLEQKIQNMVQDPSKKGIRKLWRSLDYNGNNRVSLAETDKWVVEQYPILNHKPALMRAQQATLAAGGGHDFVEKKDFKTLLVNIFYFNKLFWIFDKASEDGDRRMDFKEFQFMMTMCGMKLSPAKARNEFDKVDLNHGGQILFDEFCKYFVTKKCPEGLTAFLSDE